MASSSELRQRRGATGAAPARPEGTTSSPSSQATAPPPPRPINYDAFEALLSTTLVRKAAGAGADAPLERLSLREALGGASAHGVSLYFSAHWCPPCRAFTPELARLHQRLTSGGGGGGAGAAKKGAGGAAAAAAPSSAKKQWPVVFVSMDKSAAAFRDYFASMPQSWLAVPFEDDQLRSVLLRKMKVEGIPTLAMLDPSTAGAEAANARAAASADPDGAVFPWAGAAGGGGPGGLLGNPRLLMMVMMMVYYAFVNVVLPWWRSRQLQQQQQGAAGGAVA